MNTNNIKHFVETFQGFKESTTYQARQMQTCFASVAKSVILETISNPQISNENLTGLIQMLKFECSSEIFQKYLKLNVANASKSAAINTMFMQCGQTGYTRAGKTGISKLNSGQLAIVQKFLQDSVNTTDQDSAVQLIKNFEAQNIPEVSKGVYSPWLHYINPQLYPIVNNSYTNFLEWFDIENEYAVCVEELYKLLLIVNENDFALLDSFIHNIKVDEIAGTIFNDPSAPPFFNSYDFHCLETAAGISKTNGDEKHQKLYRDLKLTYDKVAYWAKRVQESVFPNGRFDIRRRPTNQGNNFEEYQWARIYPDVNSPQELAFTVSIDTGNEFQVKIDTVYLKDNDEKRITYINVRGDYRNSPIVKLLSSEEILKSGWNELLTKTAEIIRKLIPNFNALQIELGLNPAVHPSMLKDMKANLNKILYGPPGTGKTFATSAKAIQIANPSFVFPDSGDAVQDRKLVKEEFDRLCKAGQVVFTTFHQSMSYEEFIEGIKPKSVGKEVHYKIERGVFKKICDRALFEYYKQSQSNLLRTYKSFDELYDLFVDDIEQRLSAGPLQLPQKSAGRYVSVLSVENDDLLVQGKTSANQVLVEKEKLRLLYNRYKSIDEIVNVIDDIRAVGRGLGWTSNYYGVFKELKKFENESKPADKSMQNLVTVTSDDEIEHFFKQLPDKYAIENINNIGVNNYVLIIDEINRGNVSQIFGELITLLEKDKRLGREEQLKVTLPYSGEDFIVSPNLYVIGTMNTADRSVETLDTALRRRFSFKELMPEPGLLKQTIGGIKLSDLLITINERVEALLDRDHTIGHSFFYSLKDNDEIGLRNVFRDSIIPLLKEYFYGDFGKIALVLGKGFVEVNTKPVAVKFAIENKEYEGASDFTSPKFVIKEINDDFNIVEAIKLLLPLSTVVPAASLN